MRTTKAPRRKSASTLTTADRIYLAALAHGRAHRDIPLLRSLITRAANNPTVIPFARQIARDLARAGRITLILCPAAATIPSPRGIPPAGSVTLDTAH